jgi:hypothetical protein
MSFKKTKLTDAIRLFDTYTKTKNTKVFEKAVKLTTDICSSPIFSQQEKISALKELLKHKGDEFVDKSEAAGIIDSVSSTSAVNYIESLCSDIITKWRDCLLFLHNTELDNMISLLIEVVKIPEVAAHDRIYTAVYFYNSFNLHVCYDCFKFLCSDKTLKIEYRLESVLFLFASGEEEERKVSMTTLLEIIKNHEYDCESRYKAIVSFTSKKGIKTLMNNLKLKIPYEEEFCCVLQTAFFDDEKNEVRYRILSGQHLLQMENSVSFERKREIVQMFFLIGEDITLKENIRADALDVILRLGEPNEKTKSRQLLGNLGMVADGSLRKIITPKTIYDDSQNIHNETIGEYVEKYLEKIVEYSTLYPIQKFDEVNKEISTFLRNLMPVSSKTDNTQHRHRAYKALSRIAIDTATFTKNHVTLAEIVSHVWSKIHSGEYDRTMVGCLEQRVIDELIDMEDTCSSGHAGRFVNVLSIVEDSLKISWDAQLKANFSGRMGVKIRECQDDDLQAIIALGMMEDADEGDRKLYLKFIEESLVEIEKELYNEFVGEGYIKECVFADYMKIIKNEWLCVT